MRARSATSFLRHYGRMPALVCVPLVALAASVRDRLRTRAPGAAHLTMTPGIVALVAATAVGLVWLGLLVFRGRRWRADDEMPRIVPWRASRRAQLVALLVVVPLIVAPIAVVIAIGRQHAGSNHAVPPSVQSRAPGVAPTTTAPAHGASAPDTGTALVVAGVLVVAGAAGLVAHTRRRRVVDVAPTEPAAAMQGAVDESLRRGAEALASTDDVRLAITRCYAAMQRSLDDAGLPRSPVRTPTEILDIAIAQRLLPAGPATGLTRLFERARFSSEPLTAVDRDTARDALEALRTSGVSR